MSSGLLYPAHWCCWQRFYKALADCMARYNTPPTILQTRPEAFMERLIRHITPEFAPYLPKEAFQRLYAEGFDASVIATRPNHFSDVLLSVSLGFMYDGCGYDR